MPERENPICLWIWLVKLCWISFQQFIARRKARTNSSLSLVLLLTDTHFPPTCYTHTHLYKKGAKSSLHFVVLPWTKLVWWFLLYFLPWSMSIPTTQRLIHSTWYPTSKNLTALVLINTQIDSSSKKISQMVHPTITMHLQKPLRHLTRLLSH